MPASVRVGNSRHKKKHTHQLLTDGVRAGRDGEGAPGEMKEERLEMFHASARGTKWTPGVSTGSAYPVQERTGAWVRQQGKITLGGGTGYTREKRGKRALNAEVRGLEEVTVTLR